jgi:hypothetical protein
MVRERRGGSEREEWEECEKGQEKEEEEELV